MKRKRVHVHHVMTIYIHYWHVAPVAALHSIVTLTAPPGRDVTRTQPRDFAWCAGLGQLRGPRLCAQSPAGLGRVSLAGQNKNHPADTAGLSSGCAGAEHELCVQGQFMGVPHASQVRLDSNPISSLRAGYEQAPVPGLEHIPQCPVSWPGQGRAQRAPHAGPDLHGRDQGSQSVLARSQGPAQPGHWPHTECSGCPSSQGLLYAPKIWVRSTLRLLLPWHWLS